MAWKSFAYAALALTVSVGAAEAQVATLQSVPQAFLARAKVSDSPRGTLVIPDSSVARSSDAGMRVHTNTRMLVLKASGTVEPFVAKAGLPPFAGHFLETPASLACLYGLVTAAHGCNPYVVTTNATGGSKAIAIVDAYHYPHAKADLAAYSKQFGLPAPTSANFQQVNLAGNVTDDGWGQEAALDIEMAHAMAPSAKIILVEAKSNSNVDMNAAVDKANALLSAIGGGEVSMSWGSDEYVGELDDDVHFARANVVYFASTGDTISPSWPATSSKVVAVGGTTVARNPQTFAFIAEDAWREAGAGYSSIVPLPSFQNWMVGSTKRGIPDISAVGNPETGVWVYFTFASDTVGGWYGFGGTSVSAPLVAGIVNNSGHFYPSSSAELAAIYANKAATAAASFRASRSGDCGFQYQYAVTSGIWNPCTGVGSPKGRLAQ